MYIDLLPQKKKKNHDKILILIITSMKKKNDCIENLLSNRWGLTYSFDFIWSGSICLQEVRDPDKQVLESGASVLGLIFHFECLVVGHLSFVFAHFSSALGVLKLFKVTRNFMLIPMPKIISSVGTRFNLMNDKTKHNLETVKTFVSPNFGPNADLGEEVGGVALLNLQQLLRLARQIQGVLRFLHCAVLTALFCSTDSTSTPSTYRMTGLTPLVTHLSTKHSQ